MHSDADGKFSLDALPANPVPVDVYAPDYLRKELILLPDTAYIDIELDAPEAGPTIAGSLALPNGTPVAGWVQLNPLEGAVPLPMWSPDNPVVRNVTRTDENGEFRFEGLGLPDGRYRLSSNSKGGVVESRTVVVKHGQSVGNVRLVVKSGGRIRVSITGLMPGEGKAQVIVSDRKGRRVFRWQFGNGMHFIQGVPEEAKVTARTGLRRLSRKVRVDDWGETRLDFDFTGRSQLTGTITTIGRPLGDIDLRVVPVDQSRPEAYVTTTERGRYEAQGLSEGLHIVRTRTGHSFETHVSRRTPFDIELPPISLSGVVRTERTRRPISWSQVQLRRAGASGSSRVLLTTRTGHDGMFRFDGLVAGEYVVRASRQGFENLSQRIGIFGNEIVELDLSKSIGERQLEENPR